MLKLVNITKDYVTKGVPTVHALKGLTVNFRRNEFVAILGASGCGKTTLLNIIGGLDRYTTGDLIIEGKSTKDYNDHDWDTYRNHSVGFVFQSYNLISHQTVLGNVELALTISGIKKEERRERALKAIETVGLKGMEKKRPNQLSGGQMQRVAIARALVNDPEIVLADEPTGALDSETSLQIMDLLKEVASDRLVIMVTHNPDLANEYANRIITMKDGLITGDQNPYDGEKPEELKVALEKRADINKGAKKKSSMSFFTATSLSFFNLLSKLKRTILIAVAGSIGIIGVSSVLAVSTGVNNYVDRMQDDMLSRYPLEISETAVDMTSLLNGLQNMNNKEKFEFDPFTEVGLDSMINYLMDRYSDFSSVKTNDINDDLIDFVENWSERNKYISSISEEYSLDPTNNIFTTWRRDETTEPKYMSLNGLTQMYISELETVQGFKEYAMFVDLFTNFMNQLPGDKDFILSQYDLVGEQSKFPENANDIVIVVEDDQTLTDLTLAQMGFYNEKDFLNIARKAIELQKEEPDMEKVEQYDTYDKKFLITDIIGKELLYRSNKDMWNYQKFDNWTLTFAEQLYNISDMAHPINFSGKFYLNTYTNTLAADEVVYGDQTIPGSIISVRRAEDSPIDEDEPLVGYWDIDFSSEFKVRFVINPGDGINFDIQVQAGDTYMSLLMPFSPHSCTKAMETTHEGYMYTASIDESQGERVRISGILKKKPSVSFGSLSRGVYYTREFTQKMMEDTVGSNIIDDATYGLKAHINDTRKRDNAYRAYVTYTYTSFNDGDSHPIYDVPGVARALNSNLSTSISSLFSGAGGSSLDLNRAYLRSVSGQASKLRSDGLGYDFDDTPQTISIYPKNFSAKKRINKYLDSWNKEEPLTLPSGKVLQPEDRQELTYTDTIEIIINVINTLITTITIALVAFTSLSLVVSCFMIAVITYISTMERVKEIGVIRSLGGRKKDISRLFIAECLIIGLTSGVFGVSFTYLLALIFNLSIMQFGVGNMAILTIPTALIMIGISIALNVISGFIPAMRASSQDPVVALRTE